MLPAIRRLNIPATTNRGLKVIRAAEAAILARPQIDIKVQHNLHKMAQLYSRTILIPAGVMITGALIKIATMLIVNGDVLVYIGGRKPLRLSGYHVLEAAAGRKTAFLAQADTHLTMTFHTTATTVGEAERQMTDEFAKLQTNV